MFRYLKNLCSTELFDGDPWEIPVEWPAGADTDKKLRDEWANTKSTSGCFYTLWEGTNPKRRISTKAENPPNTLHGLAFDFDDAATDETIEKIVSKFPLPVFFTERTLTPGYWRLVCLFEKPLTFDSEDMARHFLKVTLKSLKVGNGLDKGAFLEPNRFWTSGGAERFTLRGEVVTADKVDFLYAAAFKNYKFVEFSETINISFEDIQKALAEKYPDFSKWDGAFEAEAQGPTFWIPESTSPKSAIVKANGMFTFSAHATKKFYSWRELLGSQFVDERETDLFQQIGERFARNTNTFYYNCPTNRRWLVYEKPDVIAALRELGLSIRKDDSGMSSVDRAMDYIRKHRWVDGAAPFLYDKRSIVEDNGRRILNTMWGRDCLAEPSGQTGKEIWGPNGNFPFLSKFLEGFLDKDPDNPLCPLTQLLAWMKRHYESCRAGKPAYGHAVAIVGPAGVGKTFFVEVVLAMIYGLVADVSKMLTNRENFGGELLEHPLWVIDDSGAMAHPNTARSYTMRIKEVVARPNFVYHIKFMTPITNVQWLGRLVILCNVDPKSARAFLPETDHSNRDKMMFFLTADEPAVDFGSWEQNRDIIAKEIAHFLQWLLDWEVPTEALLEGSSRHRFGVKPYYHSKIEELVRVASPKHSIASMIRRFTKGFNDDENEFSTVQLFEAISGLHPNAMRHYNIVTFIQQLETLVDDPDANLGLVKMINEEGEYLWRVSHD